MTAGTSAGTLHAAARRMRDDVATMAHETGSAPDAFLLTVAAWLDDTATQVESPLHPLRYDGNAAAVALAYLDGQS